MPFTPNGAQGMQIAIWSSACGLQQLTGLTMFPDKYLRCVIGMDIITAQSCCCPVQHCTSIINHKYSYTP